MARSWTEQEVADFLFDRLIVNFQQCPEAESLRAACQLVAAELLQDAEVLFKVAPVSDGGA